MVCMEKDNVPVNIDSKKVKEDKRVVIDLDKLIAALDLDETPVKQIFKRKNA
ncbi:hypothetical protein [Solibacillus isronensis]|uniref:hypothetical protein n=1 Tax=Solibacillus isronensis TaxID=412383 RepID=UPI0039A229E6